MYWHIERVPEPYIAPAVDWFRVRSVEVAFAKNYAARHPSGWVEQVAEAVVPRFELMVYP